MEMLNPLSHHQLQPECLQGASILTNHLLTTLLLEIRNKNARLLTVGLLQPVVLRHKLLQCHQSYKLVKEK
jgi:hypothetical protein